MFTAKKAAQILNSFYKLLSLNIILQNSSSQTRLLRGHTG